MSAERIRSRLDYQILTLCVWISDIPSPNPDKDLYFHRSIVLMFMQELSNLVLSDDESIRANVVSKIDEWTHAKHDILDFPEVQPHAEFTISQLENLVESLSTILRISDGDKD